MASTVTPPARAFYGPINPAILGVFGWEEEKEEEVGRTAQAQPVDAPQQQQPAPAQQSVGSAFLGYLAFNPALLSDFDDDAASMASGMATNGGSITGDDPSSAPAEITPASRTIRSTVGPSLPQSLKERQDAERGDTNRSTSTREEPARSGNPYAAAIEDKQNAMTMAFLRNSTRAAATDISPSIAPDELGFGQRYQVAQETASVVITNQRKLPDILSGSRDCIVCTDTKKVCEFPTVSITRACTHEPTTCLACVATCIRTDLNNRLWNEIKCPECRETLEYDDVQRFADEETKERYQTLSFRSAVSSSPNFVWCTSGCGYGQVHDGGNEQPIVTCRLCAHRSCFHHKVTWHQNLTCGEYDALLSDPVNFRSRFDTENEEAERAAAARQAQEDADLAYAQSLLAEDQRVLAEEQRLAEERKRRREQERKERAEREAREREMRAAAVRRKVEEEASSRTVDKTTKPCPNCHAPIEKGPGCSHMTCLGCKHEFCWSCRAKWTSRHSIRCGQR